MRTPIAILALLVVLAVVGVATGDLLRGKSERSLGAGTTATAAGMRAVGAAWRSLAPRYGRGMQLEAIACRPLDEATTWPLRCVGTLSRTGSGSSASGLPWIEVRIGPGPAVEGCHWVTADALPKADCLTPAVNALRS